ncbi:glutamate receptor ionotropic, kainate 2-like isoform X1 [Amblyomma americanum]
MEPSMAATRLAMPLLVLVLLTVGVAAFPEVVKIGALLSGDDEALAESALRYAVDRVNTDPVLLPEAKLSLQVERLDENGGTLQAYRKVCGLLEGGAVALLGPIGGGHASSLASSVCAALHVPQLETEEEEGSGAFTLQLSPSPKVLAAACADLVQRMGWLFVAYLYEGSEGLDRLQELERDEAMAERKLLAFDLAADDVWSEVVSSGFRNIIVDVDDRRIEDVLMQAQEAGLVTELHNFLLVSLDAHVPGSRAALRQQVGDARVYSFRMLELEDDDFILLGRRLVRYHPELAAGGREKQTQLALVHDAVHVLAAALHNISVTGASLEINTVDCDNATYLRDGRHLLEAIKSASYDGFTGEVNFDEDGDRELDDLQLYEWHRGRSEKVATWSAEKGLDFVHDPYDDDGVPGGDGIDDSIDENSLENRTIVITTILSPPFVMLKEGAENLEGNDRFEGFCVAMIERVAQILGFRYRLDIVADGRFGTEPEPGRWNGMIGELLAGKADMALAPLTMTSRRSTVLDFTAPFMTLGIGLLHARQDEAVTHTFLSPFSAALWCAVVATVLAAMLLLSLVGRLSPLEWRRVNDSRLDTDYTLGNCFWLLFSGLTLQRVTLMPRAPSTVVALVSWWLFSLVVMVAYASVLGEFIIRYRDRPTLDSLDDLLRQKEIQYGTLRHGSTHDFFQRSTFPQYMKLWQGIQGQGDDAFVDSYAEGLERVMGGTYALFMESPALEYLESRYCEVQQVGDIIGSSGYAIALPKGSAYQSELSAAVIRLKSEGTLQLLRHYWWREQGAVNCPREQPVYRPTPFTVRFGRLSLVFVFLLLGLVITMVVMLFIFVRGHARKNLSAESMSAVWNTLVEELRAAILCRKEKNPKEEEDSAQNQTTAAGAAAQPAQTPTITTPNDAP